MVILNNINDVLNCTEARRRQPVANVPRKDTIMLLHYQGLHCNQTTKRLKSCINNLYALLSMSSFFFRTHAALNPYFPRSISVIQGHK